MNAEAQIRAKVRRVCADGGAFEALSTAERIAVALVLDRSDLLNQSWGTALEAFDRLGEEWSAAALRVQRTGWQER